ncbi:alcohol dehydrogenase [Pigmentiphaga sp. NML080357]|uniref:acrylyl-CoA reductase (NADPH) n=1 Tax=Pigmentiphaga sp. NML080357 TaxID=2008675 RepID=UPI000B416477|nr:MDR family oxidoreductase [Pigmentiphaga sp. NML080357]OVZ58341.1 alcohol dehydrogenase [Pigmentiphaga sp. NML080357]
MPKAIVLEKSGDKVDAAVRELAAADFPEAEVRLRVEYSSLNYKDALAIVRGEPVVRQWPMVPGIDGAGIVESSTHAQVKPGDRVILNGWGVGERRWGCLAQSAGAMADWLVPLPEQLDSRSAMALGTAGYTAMLCVLKLERHGVKPGDGEVLVTGAAGGVGSVAISLLAGRGYTVVASTGRQAEAPYLKRLGASDIIDRKTLSERGKPLERERWAAVVDSVGSHTLANACASTRYGGVVAACGLAQGMDLPMTVAPFILRGVTLAGVDSVMAPPAVRKEAWQRLADETDRDLLALLSHEVGLQGALELAPRLLAGEVRGRTIVNVNA